MRTEELVRALAADDRPLPHPGSAIAVAALLGTVVAAGLFAVLLGPRPDIAAVLTSPRFILKLVVCVSLAGAGLVVVRRFARPDAPRPRAALPIALAPVLLLAAVALELATSPSGTWGQRTVGTNALHCLALVPVLAAVPLAALVLALRSGAPARPALAGALAGLAASGIGASLYALNCIDDSPLFVAVWYPLATALVAGVGAAIGARVLRW